MKIPRKDQKLANNRGISWWRVSAYLICIATIALLAIAYMRVSQESARLTLTEKYPYVLARYSRNETDYKLLLTKTILESVYQNARALFESSSIDRVNINISFEDLQRVKKTREALLVDSSPYMDLDGHYFKGSLQFKSKELPAKLRLKGGRKDHISDEKKWSYRVKLRDGKRFKGMKNVSLQGPHTRGFQIEPLFLKVARDLGLVSIRYDFVDASVNGEPIGLLALEEHFAKQLLESHERRESVILKFYEEHRQSYLAMREHSLYLESLKFIKEAKLPPRFFNLNLHLEGPFAGIGLAFFNAMSRPIEVFESGRVSRSPKLDALRRSGIGVFRGAIEGKIPVEQAFDTDKFGAYFALMWFWETNHPTSWTNQRFYFNPINYKIEPIAFDSDARGGSELSQIPFNPNRYDTQITQLLFSSRATQLAFKKYARILFDKVFKEDYLNEVIAYESSLLSKLRTEFYSLPRVNFEPIKEHLAKTIGSIESDSYFKHYKKARIKFNLPEDLKLPHVVFAYHYSVNNQSENNNSGNNQSPNIQSAFELSNILPVPVSIKNLSIRNINTGRERKIELEAESFLLPATPRGEAPKNIIFKIPYLALDEVVAGIAQPLGQTITYEFLSKRYAAAHSRHPLAGSSVAQVLQIAPFMKFDAQSNTLIVPKGNWNIDSFIITERGVSIQIEAGAVLNFGAKAGLLINGELIAVGSKQEPIILRSLLEGEYWRGISVFQAQKLSKLEHVQISNITFAEFGSWKTTGGVNFFESAVDLNSLSISEVTAEDAINIVRSDFMMAKIAIDSTSSDAFDGDFVRGKVVDSKFSNIGGDAVDTSGSNVILSNSEFENIKDKAVSSGEASTFRIRGIRVANARFGVASKDGSNTVVENSQFSNVETVLAAYRKKAEYDSAYLQADSIEFDRDGNTNSLVAQKQNQIILDGVRVPGKKVDIDALYSEKTN